MHKSLYLLLATTAVLFTSSHSSAAFLTPAFSGSTQVDAWSQSALSATSNPGYPNSFLTGNNAWPGPIASNVGGDAGLNKLLGKGFTTDGFGGGIYVFGSGPSGGGTFSILDSSPVLGLETVLFQIDLEGVGSGWEDYFTVSLNYNGGSQALAYTYQTTFATGPANGPQGSTREIVAFQWDLTGVPTAITSYSIQWSANEHSLFYEMQVNQSDVMTQVVPEPSTWATLMLGGVVLIVLHRRKFISGAIK